MNAECARKRRHRWTVDNASGALSSFFLQTIPFLDL